MAQLRPGPPPVDFPTGTANGLKPRRPPPQPASVGGFLSVSLKFSYFFPNPPVKDQLILRCEDKPLCLHLLFVEPGPLSEYEHRAQARKALGSGYAVTMRPLRASVRPSVKWS